MEKKKILFICTHNSARSQMAEGFVNTFFSENYEAYSAGTKVAFVRPYAIKVMQEIDVDISKHRSKHLRMFYGKDFDLVVTVCDNAKKICPVFPGAKQYVLGGLLKHDKEAQDYAKDVWSIMENPQLTEKEKINLVRKRLAKFEEELDRKKLR